ncbi:HlyD family secretion protein [Catalinimonas alkaloidigena]|uniref:HlyD family secretion protein n=1 Tax=Catalinimonas alkaloidigena TaxID=1075417 RepID=A0A1G9URX6_9BACT|nr:efflux RND transporter periplasmic adaptor subunit [Catalinimonas alkaloidigena]SDM62698.1 HlyD family secretion protein [Catalinimonas alkaloidigena]
MKKPFLWGGVGLVVLLGLIWLLTRTTSSAESEVLVPVTKGQFEIVVTATGELEAKNSVNIQGPAAMRAIGIWNTKIEQLVPEGTVVKKGDQIGALDRSEIGNKIREAETELQKIEAQYTQTRLDTSLTLREARDNVENLRFAVQERDLELQQSKYEPPATIRQAEISKEKAQREYEQARENYRIKRNQAIAKMQEVQASLNQVQGSLNMLKSVMGEFTIHAPEGGMVIYVREWNGEKRKVGSAVGAWDPTVATLPDLTSMISRTYVNEVDIRKIQNQQKVRIGLDAFPDKKLTGKVISVANVGEQRPNADAKVFEVTIEINESDTTLRPAMTTSNQIVAGKYDGVLHIPLECLHSQGDSISYVFKKTSIGLVRQQVLVGLTNENEAIVQQGLTENDQVYLSQPQGADKANLVMLEDKQLVSKTED